MSEDRDVLSLVSGSPGETIRIGTAVGSVLEAGDIVALIGDLGTGKTCITSGIARGLGVSEAYFITSPTFTLINEYPGRIPLYHLDMYRLSGPADLDDMGVEEYVYGNGVMVIEWAEKMEDRLPGDAVRIFLEHDGEEKRKIEISAECDKKTKIRKAIEEGGFR